MQHQQTCDWSQIDNWPQNLSDCCWTPSKSTSNMAPNKSSASKDSPIDDKPHGWIPEGYVITFDPDDREYIVLEFMVLAMHQAYGGYRHKKDLNAFCAARGVSFPPFCIAHSVSQVPAGRYSWALPAPWYSVSVGSGITQLVRYLDHLPDTGIQHLCHPEFAQWPLAGSLMFQFLHLLLIDTVFQQTHKFQGHHFNVIGEGKIIIPLLLVNIIHRWHPGIVMSYT